MSGTQLPKAYPPHWGSSAMAWLLLVHIFAFLVPRVGAETFTDAACRAVTTQMNSCAQRWDSIRTECTKSVTTNTVWPGPCECAYFANDLPCFDEKEFCAAQVWTQVPQWFRDGVSSCLMKDAAFTVKAQLGSDVGRMGNPFTVQGMAGNATRTAPITAATATFTPARAGGSVSLPTATSRGDSNASDSLSPGAKAGFGVGIGMGVILTAVLAFLFVNRRRKIVQEMDAEKSGKQSSVELHDSHAHIHQIYSKEMSPGHEMPGSVPQRHELGIRASTYMVELPAGQPR